MASLISHYPLNMCKPSLGSASKPLYQRMVKVRSKDRRQEGEGQVTYGKDWYEQTREAARPKRTVREEIERRRRANEIANNGRERKDLYTDNWDGSEWKGSPFNILNLIIFLLIATPTAGLIFARYTYGTLWG